MQISLTKKQSEFVFAAADEVLFGGAAGGGKTYAQVADALIYAEKYPKSRQLFLRRTLPEIEKSIIPLTLALYPQSAYRYVSSAHTGYFTNGSVVYFGYCDSETDVYRYQSSEFDVIRFDELTHFTENMYVYLLSRLRGTNGYPKQIKSTTNPGGVGHTWVKRRFIDIGRWKTTHKIADSTRLFIPARVDDNIFLMKSDADYKKRLMQLSYSDKQALLYGSWDIFEGQFFSEWDRNIHTCVPFEIKETCRYYASMDYGLDMLAVYFYALTQDGRVYVYDEIYMSGLIISDAANIIKGHIDKKLSAFYAPPDLWARKSDSGYSTADIFAQKGIVLTKSINDRQSGWLAVKEFLRITADEYGQKKARIIIFSNCINLIRTLPSLVYDKNNANDVSDTPHEYTHAPDALRYFCVMHTAPPAEMQIIPPEYDSDFFNLTVV